MKKITITYKESDTRYARGRAVLLAELKVAMAEGARTVDMDSLPAMGPGVLVIKVEDARSRRKPKKELGRTGLIETQSGKPRKKKPAGVKEEE